MTQFNHITLAPAREEHYAAFYDLRRRTMTEHFSYVGKQWDEAECLNHREAFASGDVKAIVVDRQCVGFVRLSRGTSSMEVSHFCIEPALQGGGIGTAVMTKVLEDSGSRNEVVVLNVLIGNPAIRLYRRMGFNRIEGKDPLLEYFLWKPHQK